MELMRNHDSGMFDIYIGDCRFCSVHSPEQGQIVMESLAKWMTQKCAGPSDLAFECGLEYAVAAYEARCVREALLRCEGNRTRAADALKIGRTSLLGKIKRLHVDAEGLLE